MLSETKSIQAAITAVEMASQITIAVQNRLQQLVTLHKDDRSPVTLADFAAQAIIIHHLREQLGDLRMVGEESASQLRDSHQQSFIQLISEAVQPLWPTVSSKRLLETLDAGNHDASSETYWTLDPIDGTKGFLRGEHYAISLALIQHGRVQLGVLGCPRLSSNSETSLHQAQPDGVIFVAAAGQGCWSRALLPDAPFQPCHASQAVEGQLRFCESVELAHSDHDWTQQLANHLACDYRSIQIDSQCKYGVVARGQADAYLRRPIQADYQEKIWDHAAGMIVAEEAGLRVTDIHGKRLDFSRGLTLSANHGIVCASPDLHTRLIEAIRQME